MAGFSVFTAFKARDGVTGVVNSIGNAVGNLTKIVGALAVAGLATFAYQGAQSFLDFDKAIQSAGAKFAVFEETDVGKQTEIMESLKDAAKDVGSTTAFTAAQGAEGLNFLAMAGFDVQESIAALPGVVNLAVAAEVELATATDIATDTLGAMAPALKDVGDKQKQLAYVSDILAKTTTTSNTTMEMMFETIQEAGPAFAQAGGSMNDFAAITGIMANAGIKGSKAGTAIKNMVVNLQKPTAKMSKTMQDLGIQIDNGKGVMESLPDILGQISEGSQKMTKIQRNAALATLFGKEALAGASVAFQAGKKDILEYSASLQESEGTAGKMADFMNRGLTGALNSAKSAIDAIAIAIGEAFAPELKAVTVSITDFARGSKDWFISNKDTIKGIINLAKYIVPLIAGIKALTIVQGVLNVVMSANPVAIVIVAIYGLIVVIDSLVTKMGGWANVMEAFSDLIFHLNQVTKLSFDMIAMSLKSLGNNFSDFWDLISGDISIDKFKKNLVTREALLKQNIINNVRLIKTHQQKLKDITGRSDFTGYIDEKNKLSGISNPDAAKQQAEVSREESLKMEKQEITIKVDANGNPIVVSDGKTGNIDTSNTMNYAF